MDSGRRTPPRSIEVRERTEPIRATSRAQPQRTDATVSYRLGATDDHAAARQSDERRSKPPKPIPVASQGSPPPPPPRSKNSYSRGPTATMDSIDIEEGKDAAKNPMPNSPSNKSDQRRSRNETENVKLSREAKSPDATKQSPEKPAGKGAPSRFKGLNPLQFGLWAHFLSYGAGAMCLVTGIFAIVWTNAQTYGCKIDGKLISSVYLYQNGTCPSLYNRGDEIVEVCCQFNSQSDLQGYPLIGAIYVVYSIFFIFVYENVDWGYGWWFPADTVFYRNRISPIGILHSLVGIAGLYNYVTCLGGAFLLIAGIVYQIAAYRCEAGDGGREARAKAAEAAKAKAEKEKKEQEAKPLSQRFSEAFNDVVSFNPVSFYRRISNEDKLSTYVWIFLFVAANVILFFYTLNVWIGNITDQRNKLLDGTLNVSCNSRLCHYNRKAVRYGPMSYFAPWAKGFGTCLNLQCSLLLLPVCRILLRRLGDWAVSFRASQQNNDVCGKLFARPLTRYLPLQKNLEFHKMCAMFVFFFAWGHLFFHLLNLFESNNATLAFFRFARWDGTDLFTGAVVTLAMFFIFSAAPEVVRMAKYEIFIQSHAWYYVFFLAMFLHGPNFFYWSVIPVVLYLTERYVQTQRGNRPFLLLKVEWVPPVMALYFRPVFKEDLPFKEGHYLFLNCPAISEFEWHPFTISSATDDLNMNTTRIHLETGEEVTEVPRPKNLPAKARWNKYCLASQDWQTMDPNDYLDKSETGFFDYVTLHIKVHGLEDVQARSWTRKLKEYFELMSPGKKFPFYFYRRDARGEILMGRQYGPDGKTPILRIDGPHSAPAEHYANYGTLMLVGAGIGLTPCVSILTALTKYRWKRNFNPELLHFYWVVRHSEVDSFQWLVHQLTEISFEVKRCRQSGQIERRNYCEINIYVTSAPNPKDCAAKLADLNPSAVSLHRSARKSRGASVSDVAPSFTAEDLYKAMLYPTVESRGQIAKMKSTEAAPNRLQDIWVWNGRPYWDDVFREMKDQRQHSDIGVCFCGAPVIGADLRTMCEKYSNVDEDCLFSLHKENF